MIVHQRVRHCSMTVLAVCILAGAGIAVAHHSFAMFDTTTKVTLTGSVTEFQWTNPHAYIELDVAEANGTAKKHWTIELGSGTYGLLQLDTADPLCMIYIGTHVATLPFSAPTFVLCLASLLAGVVCAAVWLVDRPTRPKHALPLSLRRGFLIL